MRTAYATEAEKAGSDNTWRTGYTRETRHRPVQNVTWNDAQAFCEWADLELPTEAQWEYAAAGPEGRGYPWGDAWDGSKVQPWGPAGAYAEDVSWCGVLGMAGNVSERCRDAYDRSFYEYGAKRDPVNGRNGPTARVLRGGSGSSHLPYICRSANRAKVPPGLRYWSYGFRASQAR